MIKTERAALVDGLAALPEEDWDRPSLCTGWTVRQVVAHMIATARMTPPKFFAKLAGSGFRFATMSQREIDRITADASTKDLVSALAARVDARTAPPGPPTSWLGETIVHGEDIFRALGSYRDHPTAHVVAVADFYKNSNLLIRAKKRITGLTLRATDTTWQHGSGPEATGPILALLLAMTGRAAALDDLTGDAVPLLRQRD